MTQALEEVKIAQIKTQVIEIGANEIISSEPKEITKEEDIKIEDSKREDVKIEERIIVSSKTVRLFWKKRLFSNYH